MQAIQLTWRTVRQLLAKNDGPVFTAMLNGFSRNRLILAIFATCVDLPFCSFASPHTWSGAHVQLCNCHNILCIEAVRCALAQSCHKRKAYFFQTSGRIKIKSHCACAYAGSFNDMSLMHSFWQLADMHFHFLRVPAWKQVWEPAPANYWS